MHFCQKLVRSVTLAQSGSLLFEFAEVFRAIARGLDCLLDL